MKNYFEKEKDELNIPEYLIKITKFSTSSRQSIEYSKLVYDLYVKRQLIKLSEEIIDTAKLFRENFYNVAMMGSYSLKDIIKILPNASSYSSENDQVGDGGDAMIKWFQFLLIQFSGTDLVLILKC